MEYLAPALSTGTIRRILAVVLDELGTQSRDTFLVVDPTEIFYAMYPGENRRGELQPPDSVPSKVVGGLYL